MTETVSRKTDPDRFEISVEGVGGGQQVAGFAAFVDHEVDGEKRRVFHHTEVGEEFGGRGLAGIVVRQALDATRDEGLTAVAVCPYVAKFVQKNPEWDDILSAPTDADEAAIRD
jgi:predicted GNAT family acetyltransferase